MAASPAPPGLRIVPGYLDRAGQEALLTALRAVFARAPLYTPRLPKTGKPMSVRMTNCGPLGWVTDAAGYRYQAGHPETGESWPPMPQIVLAAWRALADYPHAPECCLVNYYGRAARMGLHQDRDERDFDAPQLGGIVGAGHDPSHTLHRASGDALVLGGKARLAFHGVDRILPGTSSLLPQGGRISLTLRRVTIPRAERQ